MGFQVVMSNTLSDLSKNIAEQIKNEQKDPFLKPSIAVATTGMGQWLTIKLTEKIGVVANIRITNFRDLLSQVYRIVIPNEKNVLQQDIIKWRIYNLLNTEKFKNNFPSVSHYYNQTSTADEPLKRIALATELADIFEQYEVYRPQMIADWNQSIKKENIDAHEEIAWQKELWQMMKQDLKENYQDQIELRDLLLNALENNTTQQKLKSILPTMHFFGFNIIPPFYLDILDKLSQTINIYFYLVNPAPEQYWIEDKSTKQIARIHKRMNWKKIPDDIILYGNDLLLNWGVVMKETFLLLFQREDIVNSYQEILSPPPEKPITLLQKIQSDIYYNKTWDKNTLSYQYDMQDIDDGSITINGCFTPMREVEVFYNYLMELIDKKKEHINPRDIIVMITDIDFYAPYIHAVFENKGIPYTIADETIANDDNLLSCLQLFLNFDDQSFKAEAVLALLESVLVRQHFDINNYEDIRNAVKEASIYFGEKGRKNDETYLVSWEYGLKRILYGICMSTEAEYSDGINTFIPLDTAEGTDALERVKLIHFVQLLQQYLSERKLSKNIKAWVAYLHQLVINMIFDPEKDKGGHDEYADFVAMVNQISNMTDLIDGDIPFEVFRYSLLNRINMSKKEQRFANKGITFCSLLPMRSIPFKTVAMLGMNFDKYPRHESFFSFNLIYKDKQLGDRNIKNNDKHLFLETILSAQERLYISYIARNTKNAEILPPSSLIDELTDYVARRINYDNPNTDELRKNWVTIHPLSSRSSRYNAIKYGQENVSKKDRYLLNYLNEESFTNPNNQKNQQDQSAQVTKEITEISLKDLTAFFKNPPKWYLNKKWGIYYTEKDTLIADHELFEINNLLEWELSNKVLDSDDCNALKKRYLLLGKLPLANMSDVSVNKIVKSKVVPINELLQEYIKGITPSKKDIHLAVNNVSLIGKIDGIYNDKLIRFCHSSNYLKYLIVAYIEFLALKANNYCMPLIFIFLKKVEIDGKKIKVADSVTISADFCSKEKAKAKLNEMVGYFIKGQEDYCCFLPVLGEQEYFNQPYEEFYNKYTKAVSPNSHKYDFNDQYINKAIEQGFFDKNNYETLQNTVKAIWGDLIANKDFNELFGIKSKK
ncbi:MAG: exodeoxyribonuclease V subunit gamma [Phycisphaerales bacterium]|nr:exodeoxyribonuclease V subunit gamma [Phycisphaerales bacterium]